MRIRSRASLAFALAVSALAITCAAPALAKHGHSAQSSRLGYGYAPDSAGSLMAEEQVSPARSAALKACNHEQKSTASTPGKRHSLRFTGRAWLNMGSVSTSGTLASGRSLRKQGAALIESGSFFMLTELGATWGV